MCHPIKIKIARVNILQRKILNPKSIIINKIEGIEATKIMVQEAKIKKQAIKIKKPKSKYCS